MNAQDEELIELIGTECWNSDHVKAKQDELRARLTHLDKLERALTWREANPSFVHDAGKCWYAVGTSLHSPGSEPHDGTPSGRAAALVRLWERVASKGDET